MFEIGLSTVKRWVKFQKETGSILPKKPTVTKPRKVDYNKVDEYVEQNPDKTLKEIEKEFGCSHNAIFKILKKLNITYKKRFLYEERGENLRKEYQKTLIHIKKNDLIYLDESGFGMHMKKEFGWSLRGKDFMIASQETEKTRGLQ